MGVGDEGPIFSCWTGSPPRPKAVVEHGHDAAARGRRALGRLRLLLLRAAARAEEAEDAVEAEDEAHYLFGAELLAADDVPATDGRRAAVVCGVLCSVSGRRSRGRAKPGFCFNVLPGRCHVLASWTEPGGAAPRSPRPKG